MDDPRPGTARAQGVFLLGVVFLLGLVCGATVFYLGQRSMLPPRFGWGGPGGPRGGGLDHLTRELKLDAEQRRKIAAILEGRRGRMHEFLEEGRAEIRAVLRPDQQAIFDAMPRERGGRRGWRPGGPPPGDEPPPGEPPP